MNTKPIENKTTTKNERKLDFKKGMLGKFVSKKQANIEKGKGKKERHKKPSQNIFSKKGLDGQRAMKKYASLKGKTKGKQGKKKLNRKKRRILKTGISGEQAKTPVKLHENILLGLYTKRKNKNTENKKQNHKKQKEQKNTPFCMLTNSPVFLVNFCCLSTYTFYFYKSAFLLKTL